MSANETQVGGTHYKTQFQHWDLAHELDLGYYEGQISKYLSRHRNKKGKEDAEKALHFTQKLIELAHTQGRQPRHKFVTMSRMMEYVEANHLLPLEMACITSICNWTMVQDLTMLEERIKRLINECYSETAKQGELFCSSAPGASYVNQDQGHG